VIAFIPVFLNNMAYAAFCDRTVFEEARQAQQSGDLPLAVSIYRDCLAAQQFRDAAIENITQILVAQKRYQAAVEILSSYLKDQNPFDHAARIKLARIFQQQKNSEEALKHADVVLQIKPDFVPAREIKGRACLDLGKLKDAAQNLSHVIERSPPGAAETISARALRARAFLGLGQKEQAAADLNAVLAADPRREEIALMLAELHVAEGRFNEAHAVLRSAIKGSPASVELHDKSGDIQIKLKQPRFAKDLFEEALRLKPDAVEIRLKLGKLFVELDEPKKAEDEFQRILAMKPGYDPAQFNLIKILIAQNQLEKAGPVMKAWFNRNPEKQWLAVSYAKLLTTVKQLDQAEQVIKTHLKASGGGSVDSLVLLAVIKGKQGASKDAVKLFADAERKFPQSPEVKLVMGEYFREIGALDKAIAKLKEVPTKDKVSFRRATDIIKQIEADRRL